MKGLYIERCLATLYLGQRKVVKFNDEETEMLNTMVDEVGLMAPMISDFTQNVVTDVIACALAVALKVQEETPANAFTAPVMSDYLLMMRRFDVPEDQQMVALSVALIMMVRASNSGLYRAFGEMCQRYFAEKEVRKKYLIHIKQRLESQALSGFVKIKVLSSVATLYKLDDHQIWNTITHGFAGDAVMEWITLAPTNEEKVMLIEHLEEMCRQNDDFRKSQRFMTLRF